MHAVEFLKTVWKRQAEDDCYFFLSTKKDGHWKDHAFKWPIRALDLAEFIDDHRDYNIYFCPLAFSGKKRRKEDALPSTFLWADLDEANPRQCNPRPEVAWESSPGRYAALWSLSQRHKISVIGEANRNLTYQVGGDKAGWDVTQVLRVPDTRNYKYKSKPKVKLLWYDPKRTPLERLEIREAVDNARLLKKVPSETRRLLQAKHATVGKRSDILWSIEKALVKAKFTDAEILSLVKDSVWNKYKGRRNEDEQLKNEIDKARGESPEVISHELTATRLSDVEPEAVRWLWFPYIPIGKVTMVEGDPGLGKSWLTMALAAHISRGDQLIGQKRPKTGNVLILSAEDDMADTLRPRLDTLRADVKRIYASNDAANFTEEGMDEVEAIIQSSQPLLVIVDPLVAYMTGGIDLHKANETRDILARLGRVAHKYNCAIVAVRHLTKGSREKSLYRGIGSIDISAAARSVLMVGRDPDEDDARAVIHIKCNYAALGDSIRYRLRPGKKRPFIFDGTTELTAKDVVGVERASGKSSASEAADWLAELFNRNPKISELDFARYCEAASLDKGALRTAMKQLNVQRNKGFWRIV